MRQALCEEISIPIQDKSDKIDHGYKIITTNPPTVFMFKMDIYHYCVYIYAESMLHPLSKTGS